MDKEMCDNILCSMNKAFDSLGKQRAINNRIINIDMEIFAIQEKIKGLEQQLAETRKRKSSLTTEEDQIKKDYLNEEKYIRQMLKELNEPIVKDTNIKDLFEFEEEEEEEELLFEDDLLDTSPVFIIGNKQSYFEYLAERQKKPIVQIDMEGNLVKEYSKFEDIENRNLKIFYCCEGKLRTYSRYRWLFKEDYLHSTLLTDADWETLRMKLREKYK